VCARKPEEARQAMQLHLQHVRDAAFSAGDGGKAKPRRRKRDSPAGPGRGAAKH
jgi:hypothetical protein